MRRAPRWWKFTNCLSVVGVAQTRPLHKLAGRELAIILATASTFLDTSAPGIVGSLVFRDAESPDPSDRLPAQPITASWHFVDLDEARTGLVLRI